MSEKIEVKRTERGFPAHFICCDRCRFRRNTLLECGDVRVVVSTVGNMWIDGKPDTIGHNRYYETMVFRAKFEKGYWEANTTEQISIESEWAISELEHESDGKADEMHEAVVREITDKLAAGEVFPAEIGS